MNKKLDKNQLLQLLDKIMQPKLYGLSEADSDAVILDCCAGCPDPVKARQLLVECLDPLNDEELVGRALAMPFRKMKDIFLSEFPENHPLRARALQNSAFTKVRLGSIADCRALGPVVEVLLLRSTNAQVDVYVQST